MPNRERVEDRQISRTLGQVQQNITRVKNRIRRFLDVHGLNGGLKAGAWSDTDYRGLTGYKLPESLRIYLDVYLQELDFFQAAKKQLREALQALFRKERYATAVRITGHRLADRDPVDAGMGRYAAVPDGQTHRIVA